MEQLLDFEAVSLFVERTVAANEEFVLDEENKRAVAQICHRLDSKHRWG